MLETSASIPNVPQQCWALPPESVLEALRVDRFQGLSPAEVHARRLHYGPNRLREMRPRSAWRTFWDQVASPIVALLAAAAVVALAFDEQLEALAIGAVLVINTTIGFWTERRALRSMEALEKAIDGRAEKLVSTQVRYHLASAYEQLGRRQKALQHYRQYLKHNPRGSHARLARRKIKLLQ